MTPKELMKVPTKAEFFAIRDKLNLTDRQRAIFVLKFSNGLRNIDVAQELGISQDTVGEDIKDILPKLATIGRENLENRNG